MGLWDCSCGRCGSILGGRFFLERTGGPMYEIDLDSLNATLCKGLRIIVAFRQMVKNASIDYPEFADLEWEYRTAANQVQLVSKSLKEQGLRPVVNDQSKVVVEVDK